MSAYISDICNLSNGIKLCDIIPNAGGIVNHYTSPAGFKGIIKNKTLRFTDRYFLNDYSEGTYVLDLCIRNVDKLIPNDTQFRDEFLRKCNERKERSQIDNFYVFQCSFSKDEDNLALWNYYTKGDSIKGYNLGFDANELCNNLKLQSKLESGNTPSFWCGDVIYNTDKQLDTLMNVVNTFYEYSSKKDNHVHLRFTIGLLVDKIMFVGIFLKSKYFEIENEYRIVIDLHIDTSTGKFTAVNSDQCFFEKNGIIIPYVDVEFGPESLKQIRISPTLDFNTTENSLYRFTLESFPHITKTDAVKKSNIPVRY